MLDAIDMLLRDIFKSFKPFGKKFVLLGSDFRECLPVIRRAVRLIYLNQQ
jgi:hypothetical protein